MTLTCIINKEVIRGWMWRSFCRYYGIQRNSWTKPLPKSMDHLPGQIILQITCRSWEMPYKTDISNLVVRFYHNIKLTKGSSFLYELDLQAKVWWVGEYSIHAQCVNAKVSDLRKRRFKSFELYMYFILSSCKDSTNNIHVLIIWV